MNKSNIDFLVGDVVKIAGEQLGTVIAINPARALEYDEHMVVQVGQTTFEAYPFDEDLFRVDDGKCEIVLVPREIRMLDVGEVPGHPDDTVSIGVIIEETPYMFDEDECPVDLKIEPVRAELPLCGDGGFAVDYLGKRYYFGCSGQEPLWVTNSPDYAVEQSTEPRVRYIEYYFRNATDVKTGATVKVFMLMGMAKSDIPLKRADKEAPRKR